MMRLLLFRAIMLLLAATGLYTIDQTRANEVLTWMHGGASPTALNATSRLRIYTVIGNATTEGTQVATGGGYTAGNTSTTGMVLSWAAAATGSQATNAIASTTNYPRAETVVAVEVWDGAASPKRVEWGALAANKTMAAGDTLSFASGAITSALA
jgi:hypothetical protein